MSGCRGGVARRRQSEAGGGGVTLSWGSGGGVRFCSGPGRLVAVLPCRRRLQTGMISWYVVRLVGWLVDRLGALGSRCRPRKGFGGFHCRRTLTFSVSCCQVAGVDLFFCFYIMLFCSEFTSEEFSSPRTLWFSCLGVRELWMLRESSSLGGAFTGSSSLFWELGSSYPGRGGCGGMEGRKYS